jgi:hypothetical protein
MRVDALSELEDFGDGEKPWCNLVFDVVDVRRVGEGELLFRSLASCPNGEIGFETRILLDAWTDQELDPGLTVNWGGISLCSIGEASDRLLALYERWFGLPVSNAHVPPEIRCLAVLLGDSPEDIENSKVHVKLFFDGSKEQSTESYAELFLNFDLPARRAWLLEKDPEYRAPLTGWLAGRYRQHSERVH